jgi:hypothetical protein
MLALEPMDEVPNLLSAAVPADVVDEPFPHVVVPDALPEHWAARLLAEFPPDPIVQAGSAERNRGSNHRFNIYATAVAESRDVSLLWKRFIAEHASPRFVAHAVRIFGPAIRQHYPDLARRFDGNFERMRAGLRFRDTFETCDALVDAGISINTPVTTLPTSVRMAHLDLPTKLFVGLYYLQGPDERDARGGDLVLCRYKRGVRPRLSRFEVDPDCVEEWRTVPYANNVLVLFLNTVHSVHAVTPRFRTPHTRRFVNLLIEVAAPLFDGTEYQVPRIPFRARYYLRQLLAWRRAG